MKNLLKAVFVILSSLVLLVVAMNQIYYNIIEFPIWLYIPVILFSTIGLIFFTARKGALI